MSNRIIGFVLCLVLVGALACGGGSSTPEDPAAAEPEAPAADEPKGLVAEYEGLLTNMGEVLRSIQTPEQARENAGSFAEDVRRMQDLGDSFQGENAIALAGAYAARASQLSMLTRDLALEMVRIQTDPEMREAFAEAVDAYEDRN